MKPKYFHYPLVMILMFWVLMMVVTNASEKIDQDLVLNNGNVTKKEEQVSESRKISFTPILKTEFQMNRRIHLWAIASAYKFSPNLTKMIFTYLELTPVRTNHARCACVSRDGNLMLALDDTSSTLFLSDLTTGNRVRTFESGPIGVFTIADSNAFIACGTESGNIYIWNTISSKLMTTLVGHTGLVSRCCIFSNDTRIASISWDNTIRVWNIETDSYSCVYVLNWNLGPYKSFEFFQGLLVSAKHARIFVPISDLCPNSGAIIRVWNANNEERLPDIGNCTRNFGYYSCVLSVDDDQCIGYVNEHDEITLWNFMTNKCTNTISIPPAHESYNGSDIAYLSSKRLVWYIGNKKVGLYNFETNEQVYTLSLKVSHVTVSENGKYLMIIRWEKENDAHEFFLDVYWLETGKLKD